MFPEILDFFLTTFKKCSKYLKRQFRFLFLVVPKMTQFKHKCSLLTTQMLYIISIPVHQNKDGLGHFAQYWHTLMRYIIQGGNR